MTRITSQDTTNNEMAPGTTTALNQLAQVT
jgi:hypothetical protein